MALGDGPAAAAASRIEKVSMNKHHPCVLDAANCTLKVRGIVTASEAEQLIALVDRLEGRPVGNLQDGRVDEIVQTLGASFADCEPDGFGVFAFDDVDGGNMDDDLLELLTQFRLSWNWSWESGDFLEPGVIIWAAVDEIRWTRPLHCGEIVMTVAEARDADLVREMEEVDALFRQPSRLDVVEDGASPGSSHEAEALRIFNQRTGAE
jgi:hypothetical protein